jgi:hypothetical protein
MCLPHGVAETVSGRGSTNSRPNLKNPFFVSFFDSIFGVVIPSVFGGVLKFLEKPLVWAAQRENSATPAVGATDNDNGGMLRCAPPTRSAARATDAPARSIFSR